MLRDGNIPTPQIVESVNWKSALNFFISSFQVKDGYSVVADISTEYLVTDRTQQYFLELYKDDFQVS